MNRNSILKMRTNLLLGRTDFPTIFFSCLSAIVLVCVVALVAMNCVRESSNGREMEEWRRSRTNLVEQQALVVNKLSDAMQFR